MELLIMPENELKYVHVCSEGKTLGKILQSLTDIRGDIGEHKDDIKVLTKNVNNLNKQINNGLAGTIEDIKNKISNIETVQRGGRPLDPETGRPADRRKSIWDKIKDMPTSTKITITIAAIPVVFTYGVWFLNGLKYCINFIINLWPK